jgi:DNA-binding PadR family transcriptional regulator
MRRKQGALVRLEVAILEAAIDLAKRGTLEAHGFHIAKVMRDREGARRLTAYGTLYKALERLERVGYLESRWEDPLEAAAAGRPRRRFYRVTAVGEGAAADALRARARASIRRPAAAAVR